jgi:hypothetical protein
MAQAITDIDNHEHFQSIFNILDAHSQLLPEGDYINIMRSLQLLRADIHITSKLAMKCTCTNYDFCKNSIDDFTNCSNFNFILEHSDFLYLLLPVHQYINKELTISIKPTEEQCADLYTQDTKLNIIHIIKQLLELCTTIEDNFIKTIIAGSMFDIVFKYFSIFKEYTKFLKTCIDRLDEFKKTACNEFIKLAKTCNYEIDLLSTWYNELSVYISLDQE